MRKKYFFGAPPYVKNLIILIHNFTFLNRNLQTTFLIKYLIA